MMAHDDLFLLKLENDKLLVDRDTAFEVMRLLSNAKPVTINWTLRENGVFPYSYVKRNGIANASTSYVSISELAQLELNSDNTHTE